jgi:hypothetical protein
MTRDRTDDDDETDMSRSETHWKRMPSEEQGQEKEKSKETVKDQGTSGKQHAQPPMDDPPKLTQRCLPSIPSTRATIRSLRGNFAKSNLWAVVVFLFLQQLIPLFPSLPLCL